MPHNPASTELPIGMVVGSTNPFRPRANANPNRAPLNSAGAKMPATPPAPTVNPVSMGFKQLANTSQPIKLGNAKEPSSVHTSWINTSEYPKNSWLMTS